MKFGNPEKALMERGGSELSEAEERLFPVLIPETENDRIELNEFDGFYDPQMIERDKKEVERLESIFQKTNAENPDAETLAKRGKLFEAMINNQIESSNWLGENATVIIPSKYDDYVNKIDSILEFNDEGTKSHLALAIDVTKSLDEVQKKMSQVKKSIDSGELSTVKYFRSEDERGEKTRIPRVVIGADQKTMNGLAELLLRFHSAKGEDFKKVRSLLEKHYAQLQIILEIRNQLSAFKKYAQETGREELIPSFDKLLEVVAPIFAEIKEDEDYLEKLGQVQDDEVFNMIMSESKRFGSS